MWEEAAGRGGTFPPRTHHSELLEVFPELCLATVMRNPTNKNFIGFIVIAPGSFLLNQGGENSVSRTIRVAASIISHWTMNNGLWQAEGRVSQAWKGSTFWAQRLSVLCSSEEQESRDCALRPLTHFTLKSGEAAGCGVGWNSISPARALQTLLSNLKNSTKSITKSLGNTTPKLVLCCTGSAPGNLS